MSDHLDHAGRPIVVVTGIGVITSLGIGCDANWEALTQGKSGIHTIDRFPTTGLKTHIAGTVDFMDLPHHSSPELSFALADAATSEAVAQSGLPAADFPGELFLAAPPVETEWQHRFMMDADAGEDDGEGYDRLVRAAWAHDYRETMELLHFANTADRLSERYGTKGLPISLSTACASGATAIQLGVEAIRRGDAEAALCVGTDGSITQEALIRFSLLSALSTQNDDPTRASKPFSKNRDGFVMAEGAGAMVLESMEAAQARGATILAVLRGCGEKADDFHRTRSSPDGSPVIAALNRALEDAGLGTDGIDTINAHGTSTPENDRMEFNSLHAVFGDRIGSMPITSNKSMLGHTLTAAGAIEAVVSVLTLRHGTIPPTINYDQPDPDIGLDVVHGEARKADVKTVLSNSFGFGGQNACLVFGKYES